MKPALPHLLLWTFLAAAAACKPAGDTEANAGSAPPPTAKTVPADAPHGRLPAGVRPLAYRLSLRIDPREDGFAGEVEMDVELDNPATAIWLHGQGLEVGEVTAFLDPSTTVVGHYEEIMDPGVSRLIFDEELPAGVSTLRLAYRNEFDRNLAGLFKVEEQGESYALAKSESIQARSYMPGFDEPGLKATFDVRLTIPEDYEAIGNAPVIDTSPAGDGMKTVTFGTTRPMSTYLLSLAVGPFDIVERPPISANEFRPTPIPLRGVARKGRGGDLNFVLDVTPRMVQIFERELKRPYPFEKLDIVAAPQWPSGATELSAAITYREQRILVGDKPAPGARLALLGVHAHELAHMWLGNLVTPPWWDDLWLKEGFATWATPVVLTALEPDGGHELDAAEHAISAMKLDSLASTRAIREPIDDNNDIRNAYDAITYEKSLGVIRMVDQYFGPDRFRPALGRYIETFADGVADSPDFYRVIGEETGTPALTDTFRSFVEQTGVPLLDVTLDCADDEQPSLILRQARYKALGSPIADQDKTWSIPTCIRSDRGSQCVMLTKRAQRVDLEAPGCPRWLMPNAGGSGYYRWALDEAGWRSILDNFSALTPTEALSAVDSAFAAFEAGQLSPGTLLDTVAASTQSRKRQVIAAPLPKLRDYARQYLPVDDASFVDFARSLYQPVIERIVNSPDGDEQLLYADLIGFMALSVRDADARSRLLAKAKAFTGFEAPRNEDALPSDLFTSALTVAVQDSGGDFLEHLVRFRSELDDPLFESASANAIGRVTDAALLDRVHELALGDAMGPRETFGLLSLALAEPALRDQHRQWLKDHFPEVAAKIPSQWRRQLPSLAESFCRIDRIADLRQLADEHAGLMPGYRRSLAQTEEQIRLCAALVERGRLLGEAISAR